MTLERFSIDRDADGNRPEFYGREHFLSFGERTSPSLQVAMNTFSLLVGRVAYPCDRRLPDLTTVGLVVVGRRSAHLGVIPEEARYETGEQLSHKNQNFAVGVSSLEHLVIKLDLGVLPKPKRFGPKTLDFLVRMFD